MRVLSLTLAAGLLAGVLAFAPAGRPIPRREFRPAAGNGQVAAFSAAGHLLAVGGGAAPVGVFETRTGLLLRTYAGHTQPVTGVAFAPHPDTVLSTDAAGNARLWNAETLANLTQWKAPAALRAVAFAPGGGRALLASVGACWLWDLRTSGRLPTLLKLELPTKSALTTAVFGAEGRQVALGFDSGAVLVYDLATGRQTHKALGTAAVRALCLHADTLLAATGSPNLKVWPVHAEAPIAERPLPAALTAVAADPSGRVLALGFATGETMLWNRDANRAAGPVFPGAASARQVQFQPEGGALLLVSYEAGGPKTWLVE